MGGGSITYEGDKKCLQDFEGNLRERDHLEDLRVDGRITLECILKMGGRGLHWSGSEQGKVVGPCERANESAGSIKCKDVLDELRNLL